MFLESILPKGKKKMKKIRKSRTYRLFSSWSNVGLDDIFEKLLAEKRKNQNCNFHLDKDGITLQGSIRFRNGDSPKSYDLGLIFCKYDGLFPKPHSYLRIYTPKKFEPNKKILGTNPNYFKLLRDYIHFE